MTINLSKNQRIVFSTISRSPDDPSLELIMCGLHCNLG